MAYTDDQILDAARALLASLPDVLGADAQEVEWELAALLARAEAGEQVANELLALFWRHEPARQWVRRYLTPVLAPNGEKGVVQPGEPPRLDRGPRETREAAPAAAPRWILAKVLDLSGPDPQQLDLAFHTNAWHEVVAMIGPQQAGWKAAIGEHSVDDLVAGDQQIALVFFVPDLQLSQAFSLQLPAQGSTEPCRFRFQAGDPGAPVKVLISLIHAGRTLQTAELGGLALEDPMAPPAGEEMTFRLAVVRPNLDDLDRRRPFDGTIQFSRAPDGRLVGLATVDPNRSVILGNLGDAVDGIRDALAPLTDDPDRYGPDLSASASAALLRHLALAGSMLYEQLGKPLQRLHPGGEVTRVQVVQTDPDLFIPVEFIYELMPPANDAGLCQNWQAALAAGRCAPEHHQVDQVLGELAVVCPSGFWAISKVIERQSVEQTDAALLGDQTFTVRAEPIGHRQRLAGFNAALFAWSERVNNVVAGQSDAVLETLNAVTGRNARAVGTWRDWAVAIRDRRPALLVLLSHTVQEDGPAALEIGAENSGERRTLAHINQRLVKGADEDTPVVLLLGCDTAIPERAAYSFAARFRECGAAVVVGTLTPVLGEHAAPVARALVQALRDTSASSIATDEMTFGEVWRRTRSRLLAQGELTALCVTSYGDADWLLASAQRG